VVVLLGHVEGEKIIVRDVQGKKTLFEIGVREVEAIAEEQQVILSYSGVISAEAGAAVGVLQTFSLLTLSSA